MLPGDLSLSRELSGLLSGWQSLWVPGYGWFSHSGASLCRPVPTAILQIGAGIPNLDRLKALGPQLQQSIGHLPSVDSHVPVPPGDSFMASLSPFDCSYSLQSALSLLHSACLPQTSVSFPSVLTEPVLVSPLRRLLMGDTGQIQAHSTPINY